MGGTLATEASRLGRRSRIQLALTLGFMLLIVAALVAGGLYVRATVRASFRAAEHIRTARAHVADMLNAQLDEETGMRGYAAVREPVLLAPYYEGRARLPHAFARVESDLRALHVAEAQPALLDAIDVNRAWLNQIALPVILSKGVQQRLELRGKTLIDHFRADANAIDAALARQAAVVNDRTQSAIFLVEGFALLAAIAVILAAVVFTVQQYRLGLRLERERAITEIARQRSAESRAAYETEKRIADVLQEAFAERILPSLPSVRFSASYVPATEQTKIGGDWYDALQLTEDRVLLAIGDVTGHGIDAVVAMNKARQLLISHALLDATPDRVLAGVNAELVRGKSTLITGVAAVIDTRTREFAYAAAGHPPPVLFEPTRPARFLEFGSLPLGVTLTTTYQTHRVQTVPGAIIVLYTDGVIEHSRDLAAGEAALLEAVNAAARKPNDDVATAILDRIFSRRRVADDVAILAVCLSESTLTARSAGEKIPSAPSQPAGRIA